MIYNIRVFSPPKNLEDQCFNTLLDFDSNDCWDFSAVTLLEMLLQIKWPSFSQQAQNFFISNSFCDSQGNFALSRRYTAVLSGVKNLGNFQLYYWTGQTYSIDQMGFIPRSLLDFAPLDSTDPTYVAFVNDFFNPASVTPEMISLGKKALQYVSISAIDVDPSTYDTVIQNTPVQLGVPIPANNPLWNASTVAWDGSTQVHHAVVGNGGTLQNINIIDSYLPWNKVLTGGYFVGLMTVPTITVIDLDPPVPSPTHSPTVSFSVIQMFVNLLRKLGILN